MARTVYIDSFDKDRQERKYTDVEFVEGLSNDNRKIQFALYRHWTQYFNDHAGGTFFHLEENRLRIIHESYEVLWEKILAKRIFVEDGVIIGKDGLPFTGSLTTFLWRIALNKNREIVREGVKMVNFEDVKPQGFKVDCDDDNISILSVVSAEVVESSPFLNSSENLEIREIVAEVISDMSERCNQILTMFYYQKKKLDSIMQQLPSFTSKDALKTAKNKCMDRLKTAARKRYEEYLNS